MANIIVEQPRPAINGAYAATAANVAAAWGVTEASSPPPPSPRAPRASRSPTSPRPCRRSSRQGRRGLGLHQRLPRRRARVRPQPGDQPRQHHRRCQPFAARGRTRRGRTRRLAEERRRHPRPDRLHRGRLRREAPADRNPAAGKPEGAVSTLDIENSLRFNNRLMVFDTTAAGLKAILEHGVASLGNQGRFPQIGGILLLRCRPAAGLAHPQASP
jgi:hypothetical protein